MGTPHRHMHMCAPRAWPRARSPATRVITYHIKSPKSAARCGAPWMTSSAGAVLSPISKPGRPSPNVTLCMAMATCVGASAGRNVWREELLTVTHTRR